MSLVHTGILELLRLWSDLESALRGEASHGGTAEIYAYRFGCMGPNYHAMHSEKAETDLRSARALHALLALFLDQHPGVGLEVDGRGFDWWVAERPFGHRTLVTVEAPREPRRDRVTRARRIVELAAALDEAASLLLAPVADTRSVTEAVTRYRALVDEAIS